MYVHPCTCISWSCYVACCVKYYFVHLASPLCIFAWTVACCLPYCLVSMCCIHVWLMHLWTADLCIHRLSVQIFGPCQKKIWKETTQIPEANNITKIFSFSVRVKYYFPDYCFWIICDRYWRLDSWIQAWRQSQIKCAWAWRLDPLLGSPSARHSARHIFVSVDVCINWNCICNEWTEWCSEEYLYMWISVLYIIEL